MTNHDNTQPTKNLLSADADADAEHLKWVLRLESVRAYARAQAAETAEFRLLAATLDRRVKKLEHELDTIRSSRTWRIGRLVLFPVTLARIARNRLGHND